MEGSSGNAAEGVMGSVGSQATPRSPVELKPGEWKRRCLGWGYGLSTTRSRVRVVLSAGLCVGAGNREEARGGACAWWMETSSLRSGLSELLKDAEQGSRGIECANL